MNVAILCSGGVDSAVCVKLAVLLGHCVELHFFDYSQPALTKERLAAELLAASFGLQVVHHRLELDLGEMAEAPGSEGARVVPGRNMKMLEQVARQTIADEIWIGAIGDDYRDYDDCRQSFMIQASTALDAVIRAPLIGLDKASVLGLARIIGQDTSRLWSCYTPIGDDVCGGCNSCIARLLAEG